MQFEAVKTEAGLNRFVMTPAKWIEQMNAIGIISKAGRYGGTFAHSDIAMSFATWISPEFQLFIMKDYRRLKFDENSRLSLNWNLNREAAGHAARPAGPVRLRTHDRQGTPVGAGGRKGGMTCCLSLIHI